MAKTRVHKAGVFFDCAECGKLLRDCAEHNAAIPAECPTCTGALVVVGIGNASRHPVTCAWSRTASSTSGNSGAPRLRTDPGAGPAGQGHPSKARPARRSVSVFGVHRPHQLQPSTRQGARGTDVRPDRPPRRGGRRTRRRGHPGVRRTHSAARVRPVGAGVPRLQAAPAGIVLP